MLRDGRYAEFKGKEYKINKNDEIGYYLFLWEEDIDSSLKEVMYQQGFKRIEKPNMASGPTAVYRKPIEPTEVGKVYSIRTYAKYKGRDLYVFRERIVVLRNIT